MIFTILNLSYAENLSHWLDDYKAYKGKDNREIIRAKRRLLENEDLEDILLINLKKGQHLEATLDLIKELKVRGLLLDLFKRSNLENRLYFETINKLSQKDNQKVIYEFYHDGLNKGHLDLISFYWGYLDFAEYNQIKINSKDLNRILSLENSELRIKFSDFLVWCKKQYTPEEYSGIVNKLLGLGPYEMRLKILEDLFRMSKNELKPYKINVKKCLLDENDKVKKACENLDLMI
jgi:hypothetical protein